MKLVKYLFFLILIAIIAFAIFIAIKPSEYNITRSIIMNAPARVIYNEINDFRNWESWGPWLEQDPEMSLQYAENTIGEGGSYSWKGKDGEGEMKTIKSFEYDSLLQRITFDQKDSATVYWKFDKTPDNSTTDVTWGMRGNMGFMFKAVATINGGLDKMIGPMYERGLAKLDSVVQTKMKAYSITKNGTIDYGGGYYLYTTTACKQEEIPLKMAEMFGKVAAYLNENNIAQSGMPFSLYQQWDENNKTAIFSTCIPVSEKIITPAGTDVVCGYREPGKYFKTVLKGNYTYLNQAWEETYKSIAADGLEEDAQKHPLEVYLNDPEDHPNPADWITEILVPIREITSSGL